MDQLLMNVMNEDESPPGVQRDSLIGFHVRLGHLAYDTIELIAKNSDSGIEITDRTRSNCAVCAQGKQTRARQPKKDSGEHAPIHQVGAVICSDLKGPMTPLDRLGNRYLVNFVDHKSNYCQVFLAKKKDEAAKKFRDFLVQFEKEFGCSVHILRTDGGGEYRNVNLFCKDNGIARQVSEVNNQAANGKAERMHRTVLNMVRCMIFGSGLPLSFWSDAAEYATYILNRSPTRGNEGKKSPLEVLTGRQPRLSDIVVFGSKCTAFRDPGKRSMAQRAQMAHVIGRDASTKGFKVYIPSEHKVIVTRHVQNLESLKGGEVDLCTTETVVPAAPDRESPSPDEASSVEAET
ncbi:unnamed protein product [Phytophthora fragariaefolia]|uniref:Unnamed protein product n=1 Tax=Phytophthora fragariaefolia TaxID=1490495 RepID=A0A9W7D4L1_9STRA|nr:unnamed protein product [Phytophthora fragariaefolia]